MSFNKDNIYILFTVYLLIFSVLAVEGNSQNITKVYLYPAKHSMDFFEVNEVRFSGNNHISSDVLLRVVSTKPTERSIPHRVLRYYAKEVGRNRAAPPLLKLALKNSYKDMLIEIKYFEKTKADDDIVRIRNFYNQNGFHNAEVTYQFEADASIEGNALTYRITENDRWTLRNLKYQGLESIAPEVTEKIMQNRFVRIDSAFSEFSITAEAGMIYRILIDNGYYYSFYEMPVVVIDSITKTDSVSVKFSPGKRQKISNITFSDSTKGESVIAYGMKRAQLEFKEGDWYSRKKIDNSYNNLLSLGTFDMVTIDTLTKIPPKTDTALQFNIFSQYRKQQEYGFGLFTNRTAIDNYLNAGVEFSYFHRNLLGAAQVVNPFFRFVIQDISRTIYNPEKVEYEYQAGLNWAQPLVWIIDEARIGLSSQFLVSQRVINQGLRIFSFNLPVKFPIKLPAWTYFNYISFDITFERQEPLNLKETEEQLKKNAQTPDEEENITHSLKIYQNLSSFIRETHPWLTSTSIGLTLTGDDRDNPFTPTSGKFTSYSVDALNPLFLAWDKIAGIAKFLRVQLANYWFFSLNGNTVVALKQREGFIYWWDKGNSYVPFERQYFAGGANSVRGWPSRQLRYTKGDLSSAFKNSAIYSFTSDFVGNAGLIEGSLELRYNLGYPTYVGGIIAEQIANLGITTFVDWGNAYQWLIVDENTSEYNMGYKWWEIFQGIAVSVGIGARYNTPVGPFRLDFAWPLYDPNRDFKPLTNMQFHIGLGHAF